MTTAPDTPDPRTAIERAVDSVRDQFTDHQVDTVPDGAGGVFVTISGIDLGPTYAPNITWLGFHINAAYPHSDVYPHYTGVVTRVDTQPQGPAIQQVTWQNQPALQLSRRSNRWDPTRDTAALKAEKVITWFCAL